MIGGWGRDTSEDQHKVEPTNANININVECVVKCGGVSES